MKASARSSRSFRGGRIDLLDEGDQLSCRAHAPAAAFSAEAQDRCAHVGAPRDEAERAVEGGLEEVLGVLDRRRLGRDDDQSAPREQEEVQDVVRGASAEVEQDVVDVETADVTEQHLLLAVLGIGHLEQGLVATHEPEVRHRGLDHQLRERGDLAGQEVRQGVPGPRDPEQRVEVRAAQIAIDHGAAAARPGDGGREARGDDGLADAALAAAHGPDARSTHEGLERGAPTLHDACPLLAICAPPRRLRANAAPASVTPLTSAMSRWCAALGERRRGDYLESR